MIRKSGVSSVSARQPTAIAGSKETAWKPAYSRWRHGGWYVSNVTYPSGASGCVSNNYPDKKWRIVCDPRRVELGEPGDLTFASRDAAARAEYELSLMQQAQLHVEDVRSAGGQTARVQKSADELYQEVRGTALMGVYLFSHGERITTATPGNGEEPMQFCIGERTWLACPAGLSDALDVLREQVRYIDHQGMRNSDLPEDWGVIATEAGVITHRVLGMSGINPVTYLGRHGGPVADAPLTIHDAGIAPTCNAHRPRG